MKNLTLVFFALLTASAGYAQQISYNTSMQESLLKKSNKIYYIRTLTDSMPVQKGAMVYADGRIKDANGRIYSTSNGDCIKYNGSMLVFYSYTKDADGIKTIKHFVRVWSVLNQPVTLQNGIYANPNGKVRLQSGSYIKMKNKDFLGGDGSAVIALK
jgi:hypothetical protein